MNFKPLQDPISVCNKHTQKGVKSKADDPDQLFYVKISKVIYRVNG